MSGEVQISLSCTIKGSLGIEILRKTSPGAASCLGQLHRRNPRHVLELRGCAGRRLLAARRCRWVSCLSPALPRRVGERWRLGTMVSCGQQTFLIPHAAPRASEVPAALQLQPCLPARFRRSSRRCRQCQLLPVLLPVLPHTAALAPSAPSQILPGQESSCFPRCARY